MGTRELIYITLGLCHIFVYHLSYIWIGEKQSLEICGRPIVTVTREVTALA